MPLITEDMVSKQYAKGNKKKWLYSVEYFNGRKEVY